MKKAIFAIAALVIITVGNGFAQNKYPSKQAYQSKGHDGPVYAGNTRTNHSIKTYDVDKLNNIVKLTRKQEKEINKIENYYVSVFRSSKKSQTLESVNRLEAQKQHDILQVLTSYQRQKLVAYQNIQKFNSRGRFDKNNKYSRRG